MSTGQREELRIALVMNGGVSLAVWMGGVTTEIFRVVTRQHPVYAMLCDLTRTSASVDVISGTSAGGVNGAALAVALVYGGDVSRLRDVWLDSGALGTLLRPAVGDNPGSLLRGDDYFLPQLQKAFAAMAPSPTPALTPGQMPIDLKLTTTLLSGRQGRTVDDFGVAVNDVDYRAHFHFRHLDKADANDFASRDAVLPRLARAARSTASFPFAFEPSLVSPEDGGTHLKDWQGHALQTPRFVVDGGILDNKPFRGAREAIFDMPRRGPVRRVLAYVNPDPGNGPPRKPEELGKTAPSLGEVLSESILGIPQSQTIDDQLRAIEAHNKEVKARRDSVLTIVQSFGGDDLRSLAGKLYPVYRQRRLATTFEVFVVEELFKAAERHPARKDGLLAVGKRGRERLQKVFVDVGGGGWIPAKWPEAASDAANRSGKSWRWGLFPVEFSASTTLELLRLTQHLLDYAQEMPDVPDPPAPAAAAPTPAADWDDGNAAEGAAAQSATARAIDWLRRQKAALGAAAPAPARVEWVPELRLGRQRDAAPDDAQQRQLGDFWKRAYAVVDEIVTVRSEERATWDANADALLAALAAGVSPPSAGRAGAREDAAKLKAMFAFLSRPQRRLRCAQLAYRIVALAREASVLAAGVAAAARQSPRLPEHERHLTAKLQKLAELLDQPDDAATLQRLLAIEVVEYAFNEHDSLRNDVAIDLMQISGNAASPLGGPSDAGKKLLGLQLGHFGAFYKRSWRANDWTYGRLDGAERLVRLLLNPDRLYRLFATRKAQALEQIHAIAVTSVESQVLRDTLAAAWRENEAAIEDELAFLDQRGPRLPDTLPHCTDAIVARLHYGILREELPVLEDAIRHDQDAGAGGTAGDGQAFLDGLRGPVEGEKTPAAPFSPEQAVARLHAGLIAGETLLGQAGSDLFTRTLAHTAAAMQGALASENAKLGPVNLFFAALKLPLLGFYFVANGLTQQSRTSAAFNGGLLVLGAALVLLQFMWSPKDLAVAGVPSIVVTIGWGALAYGLLMSVARRPYLTGALVFAALAGAAAVVDDYRTGLALALFVFALLVLSHRYVWLQWVAGFLTLALIALWGSGWLYQGGGAGVNVKVLVFAAVVGLALVLAMWQAATLRRRKKPS